MASITPVKGRTEASSRSGTNSRSKPKWKLSWRLIVLAVAFAAAADFAVLNLLRGTDHSQTSLVLPDNPQFHELRSLAQSNPNDKELHLALAQSYLKIKHYLSARAEFDQALRNHADEWESLSGRVKANRELLRYDLAEKDLDRLIALRPDRLETYLTLAEVCQLADDLDAGKKALQRFPLDADGLPRVAADPFIAADLLSTGYSYLGDWKSALDLIEHSLRKQPDRLATRIEKGRALYALNRKVEAIPYLEQEASASPPVAEAVYLLGTAYQARNKQGDQDKAFECFKRTLQIDNKHGPAMLAFARECDRKKYKPAAAFAYQQASALGMEGRVPMLRSGDLMLELGNKEEGWFRRGIYFESMQQYDKALAEYTKLTTLHSCCRSGFLHLARVYALESKPAEALTCLLKAQQLDPKRAKQLRWSLFQSYGDTHQFAKQSEVLNSIIADGGKEGEEALYQKALLAENAGNNDEAEKLLNECIAINPRDAVYRIFLGKVMLQRRSDKNRLLAATRHLETAVRLAPDKYDAFYYLGLAYSYGGNTPGAILALRHAVDLQPENGQGYQALSQTLLHDGKREEAAEMQKVFQSYQNFEQAREVLIARCKREPHNAEAQRRLADFHVRAHETISAISCYKKCLAIQPDNRKARESLADALGAIGEREEQHTQLAILSGAKDTNSEKSVDDKL